METANKIVLGMGGALGLFFLYRSVTRPEPPADEGNYDWSDALMERQVMSWKTMIWERGIYNRVDPGLVAAIMAQESSGRNVMSRLVAVGDGKFDWVVGLMQVRLNTAEVTCDIWHEYELRDPEVNIDCGAKYLRKMLDTFTKLASGVSAYQMGPQGVYADGMVPGYANPTYITNVLEMALRFRYLFINEAPPTYIMTFPKSEWDYAAALLTVSP